MEIARLTRAALGGFAVTLIAGCGFFSKTIPPSPSMHAALESASASSDPSTAAGVTAVTTQSTFGFQAPYMPVVIPPDVRRVWVPTHTNAENELVQGHWVFLRLTDWQWATERPHDNGGLGVHVPDGGGPPPWPTPTRPGRRPVAAPIPFRELDSEKDKPRPSTGTTAAGTAPREDAGPQSPPAIAAPPGVPQVPAAAPKP